MFAARGADASHGGDRPRRRRRHRHALPALPDARRPGRGGVPRPHRRTAGAGRRAAGFRRARRRARAGCTRSSNRPPPAEDSPRRRCSRCSPTATSRRRASRCAGPAPRCSHAQAAGEVRDGVDIDDLVRMVQAVTLAADESDDPDAAERCSRSCSTAFAALTSSARHRGCALAVVAGRCRGAVVRENGRMSTTSPARGDEQRRCRYLKALDEGGTCERAGTITVLEETREAGDVAAMRRAGARSAELERISPSRSRCGRAWATRSPRLERSRHDAERLLFQLLHSEGQTLADIGRTFGISRQLVSRLVNEPDPATAGDPADQCPTRCGLGVGVPIVAGRSRTRGSAMTDQQTTSGRRRGRRVRGDAGGHAAEPGSNRSRGTAT